MSLATETPQFCTIGEVRRRLAASGLERSETIIRRLEARGVVTPIRAMGQERRLYTLEDVEALKVAIRGADDKPLDAA